MDIPSSELISAAPLERARELGSLIRDVADTIEQERIRAAVRAWGERPDAFSALLCCAAVGWVDA